MRGPSGFRPPRRARTFRLLLLAEAFAYFPENGRGRIARDDGNRNNATASGFHFLAANDLVAGPIAALHQDIREQAGNHFAGSQIIEDDDGVHRLQSTENFRALAFRDNGTSFAFYLAHARVTVQPNDEDVSQCACHLQAADMAGMKQIKATVGENDAAAVAFLVAKPQNRFLKCKD